MTGSRRRLSSTNEPTGQCISRAAVAVGLVAGDDRVHPPVGPLQESTATSGKIVSDLRLVQAQVVEVDDVEVGPVAGGEDAAIVQADRASRAVAVALDEERQVDRATLAIAPPIVEQRRGETAVADRADVRAPVSQARHRVRMGQHLVHSVEVAVDVVQERQVQHPRPIARRAEQDVECEFLGHHAGTRGACRDRVVELRFVVRLVGHLEQQLELVDERPAELVSVSFGELLAVPSEQSLPE